MAESSVLVETSDGIGVVTLNRPERSNALVPAMLELLENTASRLAADGDVHALIVTGAGDAFCSGGDVQSWQDGAGPSERKASSSRRDLVETPARVSLPFRQFPRPVIAAVNGTAVGAGFSMALACDLRIASEKARFNAGFVRRGIAPGNGMSWNLPRLIGPERALAVMFTGDWISAPEAERLGIVSKVVPHQDLMPAALALARKIAANPPIAVELTKRAVWRAMDADLLRHLDLEHYYQQITFNSHDFKESVRAFVEKREPKYQGR